MHSVGERIRQLRNEKNVSLAELARRAGLSKGHLHSIETGDTQNPSAEILFRLANELGTTIADLLGEETLEMPPPEAPPSLLEFAHQEHLTEAEIEMLARIQYRGNRPKTVEDWHYIFEFIKRTLR